MPSPISPTTSFPHWAPEEKFEGANLNGICEELVESEAGPAADDVFSEIPRRHFEHQISLFFPFARLADPVKLMRR